MLLDHLKRYIATEDGSAVLPLLLDECFVKRENEELSLREPVGVLIFALQRIYVRAASMESKIIDELSLVLEKLCIKMTQLDLCDFDMVTDNF